MRGQTEKAREALEKILRFNGKKDMASLDELIPSTKAVQIGKTGESSLTAMMKDSALRKTVFALFLLW